MLKRELNKMYHAYHIENEKTSTAQHSTLSQYCLFCNKIKLRVPLYINIFV